MIDIQDQKYCHSMSKVINYLYFKGIFDDTKWGYSFFSKHSKIKDKNVVYEMSNLPSDVHGELISVNKFPGSSKAVEVVYHLPTVFNREHYSRKAFQNYVKTPISEIQKLGLVSRLMVPEDLPSIIELHDKWVDMKLSDPRVHKITFSKKTIH